jgi:peptide/nickel transport system substrate-binding protein
VLLNPKGVGAVCLAVGIGLALLAQNAGALSRPQTSKPATSASHASTPHRGGTLTVVEVSSNTIGIDPAGPTNTAGNYEFYPVFEPLFVTQLGSLRPWLASHYVASQGGTRITIYLNKGIKFSDGTPFNASAVEFNFNRYASKTQNSECVPFFAYYTD